MAETDEGAARSRREVVRLAQERGFGAGQAVVSLGGGDVGCVGVALAVCLLPPGVGLLAGPFGPAGTSAGAVLLMAALAAPVLAFAHERRRAERIPRLYVYDGGVVLSYPRGHPQHLAAYAWPELRTAERIRSSTVGQGGSVQQVWRLELHVRGGPLLCSLGDTRQGLLVARLAVAGGAET